ncbi:MAG: T9SS type A sorting domain-containing protein [Chlorobi bacterium]|nr:T9SS type A sorting domain-containing protein [Chlorobiota bacterium]MCI0714863.1 T9SS type A sorting domain-containing protein [Chlorobiota bacterium]
MKKLSFLALVFLLFSFNLFSQNPGFVRTDPEWVFFHVDSVEAKSHATVTNPYGVAESLRVVMITSNVPPDWEGVGICDINICYAIGITVATALYPPGNSQIYIYYAKLPGRTGSATSTWKVERVSNPSQQSSPVTFGVTTAPIGIKQISSIVKEFNLSQNYPNPFNPATKINFSIPNSEHVSLRVYDILGREVKVLVNENLPVGEYEVDFDAKGLSSGMYYYSIRAGEYVSVKKMVLVK